MTAQLLPSLRRLRAPRSDAGGGYSAGYSVVARTLPRVCATCYRHSCCNPLLCHTLMVLPRLATVWWGAISGVLTAVLLGVIFVIIFYVLGNTVFQVCCSALTHHALASLL